MKTKAAILYKLNSPLTIEEIEIPKLKKGQALIRVHFSGICRSQLNEIVGLKGKDKYLPHLLGHEGAGVVKKIGPRVTKVKPGDRVILSWIKGKGWNVPQTQYLLADKVINSGPIATFTQHAVVSENRLAKISSRISLDKAALIGCAIPTGVGIVKNTLKVKKGSSMAIFGVGGVGLSAVLGAKLYQCKPIIAIDINPLSLQLAVKLGATHAYRYKQNLLSTKICPICPQGVDYAIEASGNKQAMEMAFEVINDTGIAIIAGNIKHDAKININPFDLIRGKRIIGTWGGETDPDRDFPLYVKLGMTGKWSLEKLISQKFKLQQINQALALLKKNQSVGRMLIDLR